MRNLTQRIVKYQVLNYLRRKGISDYAIDVNISAPPKDGEANDELLEFLSNSLQIKRS